MNRLLRVFFSAVLIFPFGVIAGTGAGANRHGGLKLSLEKKGENLIVLIENHTEQDIKINKEFSMDPLVGSIHFVVTINGKVRSMIAQINPVPVSEDSYIELQSGGVYGHIFETSHFGKMFNVNKGCYAVKAYYQDMESGEFRSYSGKVMSNQIAVCDE